MSDVALIWSDTMRAGDFAIEDNDLQQDGGLETAVIRSLFEDRRAEDSDILPEGETDRRGWWADPHANVAGDKIGSRLWLLSRSRQTPDVLVRAEEYVREALQWLLDDGVSDRIDIDSVEFPQRGALGIALTIHRPKLDSVKFKFNRTWIAQAVQRP